MILQSQEKKPSINYKDPSSGGQRKPHNPLAAFAISPTAPHRRQHKNSGIQGRKAVPSLVPMYEVRVHDLDDRSYSAAILNKRRLRA